ncbi:MAG: HEPN domain-containing protein [Calditrichota bacterium]
MDKPTQEKVKEWLLIAEEDHISAHALLKHDPLIGFSVCFHAQQCAEKALKGFLTHCQHQFERTHDLLKLVKLCAAIDPEFANYAAPADALAPYAAETRYPDDYRSIPHREAGEAITNAERILNFVKSKLDPSLLI